MAKLGVREAMDIAREKVLDSKTWDEKRQSWVFIPRPADLTPTVFRRNRRVIYTLKLLFPKMWVDEWVNFGPNSPLNETGGMQELVRKGVREIQAMMDAHWARSNL